MYENRIVIDPEIRHGKPVIKGTRVRVHIILGSLAGGMSVEEVAREYGIEKEDVMAKPVNNKLQTDVKNIVKNG